MNTRLQTSPHSPPNQLNMVSHPELADRSRRAPSVSSRTSHSKHHRGRSHHGGTSFRPQNEFPFFAQTGDVEIVINSEGQEKRYLLHRLILSQCSGFFEAGTSEEWSRGQALQQIQNSNSRPDQALTRIGEGDEAVPATPTISPEMLSRAAPGRRRWRYELDWEHAGEEEEPILVQKVGQPKTLGESSLIMLDCKRWHPLRLRIHSQSTSAPSKATTCSLRRILPLHAWCPIHC
jgi:hypothetical protein